MDDDDDNGGYNDFAQDNNRDTEDLGATAETNDQVTTNQSAASPDDNLGTINTTSGNGNGVAGETGGQSAGAKPKGYSGKLGTSPFIKNSFYNL